ncbi:MAG: acylphosphatase [Deltaproteobacteria bacterium]|nr:acylphosphatase [Deltaproteobacteria bacterium]
MAEQVVRRHLMVHGRVQGVWFRRATQRTARALGVAGWVRNCADGSVEVVLEGAPERVTAAVAFCHEGPSGACVDHVDARDEAPEGLTRFELRA